MSFDVNDLDLQSIGVWPTPAKAVLILVLCLAIVAGWIYLDTQHQFVRWEEAQQKEVTLKEDFEGKQRKASNLEQFRLQLEEMKLSFGSMLRQLPNKTEVANLIVDISQAGLAAGLEFELFDPQGEARKEFYAEFPIALRVAGGYHEMGKFVSDIASLPRIVTVHDINIAGGGTDRMTMTAVARTYRYIDEEEASK